MIHMYRNFEPQIDVTCFVAPGSAVIGDVVIGRNSSIWYNVVIRGDMAKITIGANTNIQDGCVIHCKSGIEVFVGDNITVGHGALLHSCRLGDGCLIGMGAIVLDGVKIGRNCLVAAGTIVPPNTTIPDGSAIKGNPIKIRELPAKVIAQFQSAADDYVALAKEYKL